MAVQGAFVMKCPGCGNDTISRLKVAFDGFGAWRHKCVECGGIYKVKFSVSLMLMTSAGMIAAVVIAQRMYGFYESIVALLASFFAYLFVYARYSTLAPAEDKSTRTPRLFFSGFNSLLLAASLVVAALLVYKIVLFLWPHAGLPSIRILK